MARDVHDVVGHSLTVVSLKADSAERLVDIDPERAKGEIAAIRSLTRQSLAEIRATVAGLRITRLADERDAALAALADAGIEASVPDDYDVVDPAHRITVAWALREATTNVIRHSGAQRVDVAWGPTPAGGHRRRSRAERPSGGQWPHRAARAARRGRGPSRRR
ncbi:histidine kinase [Janibacter limosus]|uniref:Histidine kinase n=1 Tax=Janibacter limosus TaxID=53458 RepID=A0AC61U7B5_9MICO|nr:histidine kinase [Janibacter limosus]UUZ45859.1 histidine kinase [Janibacter limosus]